MEIRFCECGQVKTVQHFLLECPLHEEARYILLNTLREQLCIQDPSVYTLLGYGSHVELPNWRDLICEEIGQYIERTERFKEIQDCVTRNVHLHSLFPINFIFELLLIYVSNNWRELPERKIPKS